MRARHVVVPLVVVGLAAALYLWRGWGDAPVVDMTRDVSACAANLRRIHAALVVYATREKHPPAESGVRLLGLVFASGALQPSDSACLTCPGPGAATVPGDVDYAALEELTSADSAYAARNTAAFPLAKFPSGGAEIEPLVACDNEHGLNHDGCMNVLYSDGSVVTLFLGEEIEQGRLPAGATTIAVGKDSPIPDLCKLTRD
jgi:hypothetical protein